MSCRALRRCGIGVGHYNTIQIESVGRERDGCHGSYLQSSPPASVRARRRSAREPNDWSIPAKERNKQQHVLNGSVGGRIFQCSNIHGTLQLDPEHVADGAGVSEYPGAARAVPTDSTVGTPTFELLWSRQQDDEWRQHYEFVQAAERARARAGLPPV
eukprot:NODE_17788_length_926_cov_2.198999.p1 GENE.NODE_17788_length_926_cov_2.198999~~NODE_17788_length_926_cov_2.198999.p1  ORF type:complete len:158 (-),score=9.48 NODE_17788_length_926_cov_2.198999:255-728(-)